MSGRRLHLNSSSHYTINIPTFHIQCHTGTLFFEMTRFLTELLEVGEVRDCAVLLILLSTMGQKSSMEILATKEISTLNKVINFYKFDMCLTVHHLCRKISNILHTIHIAPCCRSPDPPYYNTRTQYQKL